MLYQTKVQQLIEAIKAERKAEGWDADATAHYLVGYLGGLVGSLMDEATPAVRQKMEDTLQYRINQHSRKEQ